MRAFPKEIRRFAEAFVELQKARQQADYALEHKFSKPDGSASGHLHAHFFAGAGVARGGLRARSLRGGHRALHHPPPRSAESADRRRGVADARRDAGGGERCAPDGEPALRAGLRSWYPPLRGCSTTAGSRTGSDSCAQPCATRWRARRWRPRTGRRRRPTIGVRSGRRSSRRCPRTPSRACGSSPGSCSPSGTGCPPTACVCERSPPTRANASSAGCSGPRKRGRYDFFATCFRNRRLGAAQARALRIALGLGGDVGLTAEEVCEVVLDRGMAFALANGWRLARRCATGADRIEVERPADTDLPALKRLGCTTEIVSWRTRVLAPCAARCSNASSTAGRSARLRTRAEKSRRYPGAGPWLSNR